MTYQVHLTPRARRQFDGLPKSEQQHVANCIDDLTSDPRPRGCEKIKGREGLYRARSGKYRIVYSIHDDELVVLVVLIGDHRDIYRYLGRF